jgi:hypothetical protein
MDLGKALTAHLPSIEAKLSSEYGVHAKVEVRDQTMGTAADNSQSNGSRGSGNGHRNTNNAETAARAAAGSTSVEAVEAGATSSSLTGLRTGGSRLDVQA